MAATPNPEGPATFIVSSRKRRAGNWEARDTSYDDFRAARDFAVELTTRFGHYQSVIFNSKGVRVYDSRSKGAQPMAPPGFGLIHELAVVEAGVRGHVRVAQKNLRRAASLLDGDGPTTARERRTLVTLILDARDALDRVAGA